MASFSTTYSAGENHYSASLAAGKKYVFRVARATAGVSANELTWSEWSDELLATTVGSQVSVGSDLDLGTGKILFSNVYQTLVDLPDPASYHGMFAHVHAEAAAYYAHAGNWVRLADAEDVPGTYVSGLNGLGGSVILAGGSNIQIGQAGNQLTISSTQTFSTLNGEAGALSLVGGSGIAVSTVDNIITVSATAQTDVNGITGAVGIVAGDNINVTTSGQNITISGTQGGIVWGTPPDFPTDPGSAGDAAYDSNFLYLHNGTEWKRATLSQWAPVLTVSQSPSSQSVVEGENATFSAAVVADRGLSPTFQWQRSTDSGSSWVDIAGATAQNHTESNVSLSDSGNRFRLVASDANASSVTTDAAELTVGVSLRLLTEDGSPLDTEDGTNIRRDGGVIVFSQNPSTVTANVTEGDAVVFSSQASLYGATGSISYQWYYVEGGVETQITQVDSQAQPPTSSTYVREVQPCDDARQFFVRATSAVAPPADSNSASVTGQVLVQNYLTDVSTQIVTSPGGSWYITVSGVPVLEYWYKIQHADVSPFSPPQESDWQDVSSAYVQAQPDSNGDIVVSGTYIGPSQIGPGGDGHYRLAMYRRVPPEGSCAQKFSEEFYSDYTSAYSI